MWQKLGVVLFSMLSLLAMNCSAEKVPVLKILNWEDYLSDEIVKEFEQQNNVNVEVVYYEHDEERDELLATRNGAGFDIVLVDGQSIPGYGRLGWLVPISEKEVPNLKYLDTWWKKYNPSAAGFTVPYGWGSFGIAYRSDLVDTPVTSYAQLLTPNISLHGKIIMSPQALELLPVALKALGYSMSSIDGEELDRAGELLKAQQPYVCDYHSLRLDQTSDLVSGKAQVALAYSSDAVALQQYNEHIVYTDAAEGQILWFDYWVVLASSKAKTLAFQFLNYLQEPKVNARNVEDIYTATFNKEARKYIPSMLINNQAVFPVIQDNAEYFIEPKPQYLRKIMNIWHQLGVRH